VATEVSKKATGLDVSNTEVVKMSMAPDDSKVVTEAAKMNMAPDVSNTEVIKVNMAPDVSKAAMEAANMSRAMEAEETCHKVAVTEAVEDTELMTMIREVQLITHNNMLEILEILKSSPTSSTTSVRTDNILGTSRSMSKMQSNPIDNTTEVADLANKQAPLPWAQQLPCKLFRCSAAAAVEILKAENSQNAFIGMAMGQASKLFDQQYSQGNVSSGDSKESAIQQAGEMAMKMFTQSQGGSGGASGLMGLASKFF